MSVNLLYWKLKFLAHPKFSTQKKKPLKTATNQGNFNINCYRGMEANQSSNSELPLTTFVVFTFTTLTEIVKIYTVYKTPA